jgi:hypothetical protein
MVWLKKLKNILLYPYTEWKRERKLKKRLEELRKQDPFIYK